MNEVTGTLLGAPTGPPGTVTSLSTDAPGAAPAETPGGFPSSESPDRVASVLIYCKGQPVQAPLIGDGFALCGCGQQVRVVW